MMNKETMLTLKALFGRAQMHQQKASSILNQARTAVTPPLERRLRETAAQEIDNIIFCLTEVNKVLRSNDNEC